MDKFTPQKPTPVPPSYWETFKQITSRDIKKAIVSTKGSIADFVGRKFK